jgi:multiple sugar transport system substrate-binding protein
MNWRGKLSLVLISVLLLGVVGATAYSPQKITWMSTQLVPIAEAEWVRNTLLPPFTEETGIEVEFVGAEYAELADRLIAEYKAKKGTIDLVGDLHGGFIALPETLKDLTTELAELKAKGDRTFVGAFLEMSLVDGKQLYIPWMQATYLMVINKKALDYLPPGINIWGLSYADLLAWAESIYEATGEKKLGIPAGPRSLLHRFAHGYLYPSFTGSMVKKFKSPEAVEMWQYVKALWEYVHPAAPTWDAMDTPLLAEDVLIAWDHTARVKTAIVERPDDFIAIPSPAGLAGRGAIIVLAGVGIPLYAPNPNAAFKLIEYLSRPDVQVKTLEGVGFFSVVEEAAGVVPPGALRILAEGVTKQAAAPDFLMAMIPGGLGGRAGEFSKIYRDTFMEIVVKGRDIEEVLEEQGKLLKELYEDTKAPCPPPDPVEEAPCVVE